MRRKFLLKVMILSFLFVAMGGGHLFAQNLLVNCDYNSSTEGYGTTKFSNYASAYAYATANATNATIVIEKTNTLSGNTFDNNHKNYSKLAVVIKDGATMGNALSKWDMTYPVTVEPGGTLTCARPISASVSNIHIKNKLIVGAKDSSKKAYVDFLSDTYQDCDISIRYNGSIEVYNADFKIQDLDAQGKLTIEDSEVYVDGAFASATFFATTLTNTEMVVNGNQISGGLSDFAGGDANQLGNVKINNSTLTINEGTTKVAANVTATDSDIDVNSLTINSGKKLTLKDGSTLASESLTSNGTIELNDGSTIDAEEIVSGGTVTIDGVEATIEDNVLYYPVADFNALKAAVEAGKGVKLTADITATGAVDGTDANIDLNEKTLKLSVGGNNFFGDSKVKNGSINITGCVASGDCIIGIGDYSNSATLTFDNVNVTGDGYSSAYAVLYVYNSSELNINGGSVVVSNDNASAGGVIKAHKAADGKINIVGTEGNPVELTFNNAKIGMLDGTVLMNYVDLDITGGANAINQSALTIKNSTLDITGADGRALTLSQGNVVVENSTLNFSDCSEGEIRFKKSLELTTDNTSTINECTTYADASATDAKINGVDVDASESSMAVVTVENGTTTVKEAPQGNDFTGYTSTDNAIWGETWGNAYESFVIKVLDANGNVMGTTSLNNIDGIIDGDVNVTWSLKLNAASNTDGYWDMSWTTAPYINNMPAKVELWVDDVKVSGGNVVLNGPDEINKIYAAVTDNDGKIYSYHTSIANAVDAITGTRSAEQPNVIALLRHTDETVTLPAGITLNLNGFTAANVSVPVAQIGETPYYTLAEAVAAAQDKDVIEIIKEGNYTLPEFAGKELTFKGSSTGTSITDWVNKGSQGMMGSTVHFENLTISGQTGNYYGLFHTNAVTYKDCNINGLRFLYSPTTFTNCAFNANGVEHSFWTYGASNVTVTGCTFTYTDRAVNCYSENGANHELDITFEGCSFTYAGTKDAPEGAVEINSSSVKSIDLVMDGCTAPEKGAMWFNSQWDPKHGANTVVEVDGVLVWTAPVKIGETKYGSLQAAINAAVDGDVVTLHADNAENVTVTQKPDVKFTIDGADKTMTGTITIDGKSAAYATAGITVKNMNFTAATEAICINLGVSGNNNTRYTSNVTVKSCNFTGTDKTAVGIKSYTGGDKNLIVNDCTATGMHSLMQLKNTAGVSVTECEITDSKNGISLGASSDVAINETTVNCDGYGVRADANGDDGNATITNCTIEAFIPVVVRNASKDYALQFDGENTMTATNEDGLWCAIGTKEYEENGVMPTAPTGDVTVTLNDTGLSMDGVYGEHFALNGEGTAESPYLINNLYELKGFRDLVDTYQSDGSNQFAGKYFKLTNDIDLNGINWDPIGTMNGDHGSFKGVFDGGDHIISNLHVEQEGNGIGLFARTAGNAVIKNLKLNNVTVKSTNNSNYVGGLVGNAYASTKIENVHVSGNVYISGRGYIGGIAGHGYVVMDNVSVVATGDGHGNDKGLITSTFWCAGGVLGYAGEGATNIMNAYVENVVVTSAAGGLGAIVGMAEDNNGTQPISGSNLSAKNVEIKTYTGAYGDSYANYALGYLYGGNPTSILTGELSVEEVKIETSNGVDPEVNDAVAQIGNSIYFNLQAALNAAVENETITLLRDIKIAKRTEINNRTLTIDGNGKTIRQDENFDNTIAMFDITGGKVTINNVIFDGVKKGAVVRTVGTEFAMDNVTAQNSVHTVGQGLFRLLGQNTITNSKFLNNNCSMVITLNYDGESNTPQLVENCLFEGNECNSVAALYYVKGAGCTIKDSEFVENTVNCNNNGATVYLGFTENNVVTGNIFDSNSVIDASTSARVAGAIFFGYEAEIENNVFVGNTASNANNDVLGQICTSTYYDCTIDLSGNYWGGEAPEYGKDYTIQHTASEHQGVFQLDNYYKTFTTDENGNVELGDKVNIDYVAQVGKFSYETLAEAFTVAQENETITLLIDTELSEMITIPNGKTVVLDLNGKTITGTDNTSKNFSIIDNRGNLTITDSSDPSTGKITLTATIDSDWNRYSAVIANNPGGKLTIEAGTLEHLGGTDMAYGIDNLTNGKGTYAETVINGGTIKSTYRGIRQFLNGTEAQNILTVKGGTIEGVNKSIWMQDPNKNANTGKLTVDESASLKGDVYLYVCEGSTEWPVEVSIASAALKDGAQVLTANVPAGYELKLVDGVYGVCSVEAKIGEVTYATLAAAVNAANEGDTITLVTDITFTEATRTHNSGSWYDGLYYSGDKSFTIDLDSYTIGHDNSVNDYLLNFKNDGAKANVINLINGTIEAGSTAYCALATSSSNTNKITINTENINIINNNSNGSTIKVRGGVELNVNAGTVITGTDSYLGIECVASTVNIYDGAEIYMNGSTSYNGCLVGACANGTVNVYGGYGEGVKGGFIAMTSGGTINVAGGEWIANTDGTVGDNSNLYVLTAQNNKNESGYAGASIINVTGGTFRGGMDAWILNDDNVEKAELNISGGNFNADPTSYVVSTNYKVVNEDDGTYTVEVDGFEKFYTAEGVETTSDNAAYSLSFTVTDYANNKVSVKIGNKKPAQNSAIHLVTPKTVEFDNVEFNVTSVANSGFYGTSFKKVTISEGVETIGNKALHFMSKLTELVLPSTLVSVGEQCIGAYNPNSVPLKSIVCYAEEAPSAFEPTSNASFQTCVEQQTMLIVPNAADYTVYSNANGWKFTNILGIGSTKEIAGKDDKYTLLATVTSIEPNECSIQIGNTKPAANSNAELEIPEVVDYFPSVEGLDFTVTSIPDQAFSSCLYFVGDLVIPQNVRTIGASAFNTSHFVANETVRGTLTLNEGLVSIGSQAFKKDYFKGDLSIPSTVETIASNAFQLASFDGILTINGNIDCANAFGGTGFTELVLVEGVEEIKDSNAFSGMLSLKEVVLPSTLQTVGMAAFKDDDAIEVIHTYATEVPAINSITGNVNYKYAFSETVKANAVLYVHGTSYDDVLKYKNATNEWNEFANIHLYGAVAQIEEVEYLTIQDAINAAQAGETITVIDNVELTETITVAADKEVVFDLNGKVVSYTTTEYVGEAMITNNGNLTINDSAEGGKLSYAYEGGANSSYGFGNSTIENKGVLTINAGTVENTSAAMSHASYAINTGAGATLNVEGGNILNLNGHAVRMVSFGTELNTVNINGGYIKGTRALQVQLPGSASSTTKPAMDLNITGGELMSNEETYNLAIYVFSNGQSAENVSVEISGGTFNGNVAVNAAATNSMLANAVAITGGTFNGDYGVFSYSDEDAAQAVISITGGTFATNYSEWYAEDEQYVFELNENGTYSVVEQTIFTQTRELAQGWNWFSAYVDIDLESLQNALGENATIIKNHTTGKWTKYEEGEWYGTLETISPKEMYIINTSNTIELTLVGELVELTPITIKNNWNAIGYMLNEPMSVESALNSIVPAHGDYIKSRDQYAAYDEIDGWYGTLETLIPGEGYMLKSNYSEDRLLTYSYPTRNSNSEVKDNITTDGNYWTPNHSQYPNNMTMTAMVEVEGGDYEVAAFVDGEVRGSARPIYVEALDAHILFLTIHGDEIEEMTFRYYDIATGEEFELNDRINYSNDAIIGSLTEPYIFNRGTTGIGEASLSDINIYPNPTTTGTEINLQATCDTVEVFNALGVKVAEYHNVDSIDAFETAGIYVIRITDNGDVKHCRLIVK